MARVPLVEEKEHPELSELIAKIKGARGGRLINIYRLMLHSPALASAWFDLNQAVRYGTEIDGPCRELSVIRDIDVPDTVFAEVRQHFSERQVVELTMLIGAYNMLTRFLKALKVDPEP